MPWYWAHITLHGTVLSCKIPGHLIDQSDEDGLGPMWLPHRRTQHFHSYSALCAFPLHIVNRAVQFTHTLLTPLSYKKSQEIRGYASPVTAPFGDSYVSLLYFVSMDTRPLEEFPQNSSTNNIRLFRIQHYCSSEKIICTVMKEGVISRCRFCELLYTGRTGRTLQPIEFYWRLS